MEKKDFIESLKELTSREDLLHVGRDVNDLKTRFGDYLLEEDRQRQVAQLEAQERGEEVDMSQPADPLRDEFFEVYGSYKVRRKELLEQKSAEESRNLSLKRALLKELQELVANEENIGALFGKRNEIHDKWKHIGDIPRDKQEEIQHEYSRLTEEFFYNVTIYKELKEFDLKKNFQLKNDIIEQVKALVDHESIKEVENNLRNLQNEWEGTGPVGEHDWEELKERYWTGIRAVREKIDHFYDERRHELRENLTKKEALLGETRELITELDKLDSAKKWEDHTASLLDIQERWKKIGFGPKKENEEVWVAFRAECDRFFEAKKAFFDELRSEFNEAAEAKQKLVEQAVALKENTDWKATADKLISLQKQWKKAGHAGQKNEQRLWKEFRGACDSFFNARQKHFEAQDQVNEQNLLAKQQIIDQIRNYSLAADKKQALADLREFSAAFNAIGHVPMSDKDTVYEAYKQALDEHYQKLKLEGEEKEKALFQAKMDTIQASPNAERLIEKEKSDIRRRIDTLNQEIIQFENNLGFFASSKSADALKKEVMGRIDAHKRKIEELKAQLKMFRAHE